MEICESELFTGHVHKYFRAKVDQPYPQKTILTYPYLSESSVCKLDLFPLSPERKSSLAKNSLCVFTWNWHMITVNCRGFRWTYSLAAKSIAEMGVRVCRFPHSRLPRLEEFVLCFAGGVIEIGHDLTRLYLGRNVIFVTLSLTYLPIFPSTFFTPFMKEEEHQESGSILLLEQSFTTLPVFVSFNQPLAAGIVVPRTILLCCASVSCKPATVGSWENKVG